MKNKLFWIALMMIAAANLRAGTLFADVKVSCLGYSFDIPGDVSLDPQFEGTLMMTSATGEITLINEGDAVPAIPAGATVEIFKGTGNFKADGKDVFEIGCEKDVERAGEAKILTGGVNVVDPTGDSVPLESGSVYPIKVLEAPPTAQTNPEGTQVGDLPPVDSRNVPQSP